VFANIDQHRRAESIKIPLRDEFVFLKIILDRWPHWLIGWDLDRNRECALMLTPLRAVLLRPSIKPGLAHHSGLGSNATMASAVASKCLISRLISS